MHAQTLHIDIQEILDTAPLKPSRLLRQLSWMLLGVGVLTFGAGLLHGTARHLWAAYLVNLHFFMGLACGAVTLSAIFQVVRAKWSMPIARVAEANVSFLPWAYLLWLATYFGKESLYPWARGPVAGREYWMQPDFVYARFAVLLGLLFLVLWRFVRASLRSDIGYAREFAKNKEIWAGPHYAALSSHWQGSAREVAEIQPRRSWYAPIVIALYAVITSLFAFELVMSMDSTWYANMFGGFTFIGNIYVAWAVLGMTAVGLAHYSPAYRKVITTATLWDMGKLTFAFCMLWGYLFWAHFLPQWYGNLPEETQWLIMRTREYPWKGWAWVVFPMCFIMPFITLLSRDVKKTPCYFAAILVLIFCGVWGERYLVIMPNVSPESIPFGWREVGLFAGFIGAYALAVQNFLAKYPFVQVSHPATRGETNW